MARTRAENGGVSQADMVRDALSTLGADAKPRAIQDHVKQKHGKELSRIIISNYKSNMKKGRLGGLGGTANPVGRPRRATAAAAAPNGAGIQLEDLEAVRGLVGRLGAAQVRRLVEVLA